MKVSVLGMGRMGQALARRLLDSGHEVVIWNRTPGKAGELVERGARESEEIGGAVTGVDIALTSLANDEAVRDVACGEGGIRQFLGEGSVYVDSSTVSPALSRELEGGFQRFVAMPVLGSPVAVASGDAIYLLGGRSDVVAAVDPLFPGLSEKSMRFDRPGLASAGKLAVNLLLLDGIVALAEAFAVGRAGGLSPDQLRKLLGESPMVAPGLKNRFEGVLSGDQEPWWGVSLGVKDAGLAIDLVDGVGRNLPLAGTVRSLYAELAAEDEDLDIAEVGGAYRS